MPTSLQAVADRIEQSPTEFIHQTFAEWWSNMFDIEITETDNPNRVTMTLNDVVIPVEATYRGSRGWQFTVNGVTFSARGDLPRLPLEQRQDELVKFVLRVA